VKKPPPNDLGGGFVSQSSPQGAVWLCEGFWRGLWVCGRVWVLDPLDRILFEHLFDWFVTFSLHKNSQKMCLSGVLSVLLFFL
jgi:hypothetical protein